MSVTYNVVTSKRVGTVGVADASDAVGVLSGVVLMAPASPPGGRVAPGESPVVTRGPPGAAGGPPGRGGRRLGGEPAARLLHRRQRVLDLRQRAGAHVDAGRLGG